MAYPAREDDRRRRRRGGWWWWLVALAIVVVAILLLVRGCGGDSDSGSGGGGSSQGGTLTTGSTNLLAAAKGSLASFAGKSATADGVRVQSVVNETGFWVGTGADARVFVETEQEGTGTKVDLQPGDAVSFDGTIEKNKEAETYGLRASQGADLFRKQGYHVRVQADAIEKQ